MLEAEDAEIIANAHIEYSPYASRYVGVGNIGNSLNAVIFHYNAPQAGEYEIAVHYSSGQDRDMFSQVNGGEKKWETYTRASNDDGYRWDYSAQRVKNIRVQLQAGENTIKFSNDRGNGQYAPDLDYIVITSINLGNSIQSASVVKEKADGRVYNLNGQEVTTLRPGVIYIRNGKKFIFR